MARWKSEHLKQHKSKALDKKANSSGEVKGTTGTGRQLVPIEIHCNGQKEIHYVFEGSQLEKFWRNKANELEQ